MTKMSEHNLIDGGSACNKQAISLVSRNRAQSLPKENVWTDLQNNNNNAYYVSLSSGSANNNNKNNTYKVVVVEPSELCDWIFESEADCWSNKHDSLDAAKYHYTLGYFIFDLIKSVIDGTYYPHRSICFIIVVPRPREVFAAHYFDRILHHTACDYMRIISERLHNYYGNVSFGNRKGYSAYHAALHIQEAMNRHPNGKVIGMDISGCFMSIDKDIAFDIWNKVEQQFRPSDYPEWKREVACWLIKIFIYHNPASNCERHSPIEKWDLIPKTKSLFYMNGLPIGNFYCQVDVGITLSVLYIALMIYDPTIFVDDSTCVVDKEVKPKEVVKTAAGALNSIKMKLNEKKLYIQPVRHGILKCGYMVYPDRIYLSNRPISNCFKKIRKAIEEPSLETATRLVNVLNSYTGQMCHLSEYNTQLRIMKMVMNSPLRKYMFFKKKKNHLICSLRRKYKQSSICRENIFDFNKIVNNYYKQLKLNKYDKNESKSHCKAA